MDSSDQRSLGGVDMECIDRKIVHEGTLVLWRVWRGKVTSSIVPSL